jgi:predicted metalloprotease with PDZ domain
LALPGNIIDGYRREVVQAYKLFGAQHYDHYDMLMWLSSGFGPSYFEQHRSGENALPTAFFSNPAYKNSLGAPFHGFVHSWNGMFRTPATMWTADFNTPQQVTLLWIFEGLTVYWNNVLNARSGVVDHEGSMAALEKVATDLSLRSGLQWRTLQDVSNELVMQHGNSNIYPEGRRQVWPEWQLDTSDSYNQGEFVWLDIDTLIRKSSGGKRSLDDFARGFFGINPGSTVPVTYTFDDLVAGLNAVEPYDWETFLRERVDSIRATPDLDGIERGGYQIAWTEQPSAKQQAAEDKLGNADLRFSLGLALDKEGSIATVIWGSPAWKAGLITGEKILAVNGQPFTIAILKAAITAAQHGERFDLRIAHDEIELSLPIVWNGGLRYPHLQHIAGVPALLDDILQPRL